MFPCHVDNLDVKFLLLHDSKSEDGIKGFLTDCHELYIKVGVAKEE